MGEEADTREIGEGTELKNPAPRGQPGPPEGQLLGLDRPMLDGFDLMERVARALEHRRLAGSGSTDENERRDHTRSITTGDGARAVCAAPAS
jgi:hypothetical protein